VVIAAMKKILIAIIGGTVLLIGLIMVVTPGPAIIVIPIGLAILATEFAWARHYKDKLEARWTRFRERKKRS
jgi:tellurite resistance protein TerC